MSSFVKGGALATILALVGAQQAGAQSFKWWHVDRFQQELALVPEQVARIEEIYKAAGPAMRAQKATLDRLQVELQGMVNEGRAEESAASDLIARVESARAELGRLRGVMLYRMRRVLTTDQHVKLKALFAERERSRRGKSTSHPGRH